MFFVVASIGIPLEMHFGGGHQYSSKKSTISKPGILIKVNIQMQKSKILDQKPVSRYIIYVSPKGTRDDIPAALASLLWLDSLHLLLSKS